MMQRFLVGDTVSYGIHGICKITNIKETDFGAAGEMYYILSPIFDEKATVYVPCEKELLVQRMKRVLSPAEIYALIREEQGDDEIYIENPTERKKRYTEILLEGDKKKMIRLIKALHFRKTAQVSKGKKLHISDEYFLKEAEKHLHEEFAYVLNISKEQVVPFILGELGIEEK